MFLQIVRKSFLWILLLASISLAGWSFLFRIKPCQTPIQYHIGSFDSRFGITQKDFLSAIDEAEKIWDKPFAKTFFQYDSNKSGGELVINLIYDQRQQATQQTALFKADVNKTSQLAGALKQQYLSLESQYAGQSVSYNKAVQSFQTRQDAYGSAVDYWNSHGGAPASEYEKLTIQKNNLIAEHTALDQERLALNNLVDEINTFISKYNLLVENANTTISNINQSAGAEFQEGIYDPNNSTIDIYEFSDHQKLVRVLAHELGHALSLDHNKNPKSIMYTLNMSENMTATPEDISALKAVCAGPGISPIVPWMVRFRLFLGTIFPQLAIN